MMNTEKYLKVLEKMVVTDLSNTFSVGCGVFQQDSAPCHKAKKVMKYMKEIKIKVLDWPGNFSDLDAIENLWSIIKLRLRGEDCTTKTKLIEAIIRIWFTDSEIKEKCLKLVDSMSNRVQQVLKNGGGHTGAARNKKRGVTNFFLTVVAYANPKNLIYANCNEINNKPWRLLAAVLFSFMQHTYQTKKKKHEANAIEGSFTMRQRCKNRVFFKQTVR